MLHPLTFFSYTFSLKSRRQSLVSSLDDSLWARASRRCPRSLDLQFGKSTIRTGAPIGAWKWNRKLWLTEQTEADPMEIWRESAFPVKITVTCSPWPVAISLPGGVRWLGPAAPGPTSTFSALTVRPARLGGWAWGRAHPESLRVEDDDGMYSWVDSWYGGFWQCPNVYRCMSRT